MRDFFSEPINRELEGMSVLLHLFLEIRSKFSVDSAVHHAINEFKFIKKMLSQLQTISITFMSCT